MSVHVLLNLLNKLVLYIPVNIFSVMLGRLPGLNRRIKQRVKCLAQGHNTVPQVRLQPATL